MAAEEGKRVEEPVMLCFISVRCVEEPGVYALDYCFCITATGTSTILQYTSTILLQLLSLGARHPRLLPLGASRRGQALHAGETRDA